VKSWKMSRRLIGSLVALIGGIWLAGVVIAAISIRHGIDEVFDSSLQETAQRLMPLVLDDLGEQGEYDEEERRLANPFPAEEHKEHLLYQVRDARGRVILRSHDAPAVAFPAPLTRGYFDDGGRRYFTEVAPNVDVFVQVAELPQERREAVRAVWLGLMTPLLGLLPIAALVIFWTVRRTTRPILEVQRQIGLRSGENLAPIDPHGLPDELAPIIHDMNRLLERLKAALEAERSFAANSAHELRNPVAAARAQAEVIAESLRGSPDRERMVQLIEMLGRLSKRIEKMLQLARAEAGLGFGRTETDLVAVTRLVMADYARRPQLTGRLAFDRGPLETLTVNVDPDALGIALQNLIDNALSHGAPGTTVEVSIGPGATVHVINEGPVVNASELAALTKRFERAQSTRAPGAGLGLAIVEQIMHQAGGHLELASPAHGRADGFKATLVFPAGHHGSKSLGEANSASGG
jgi:two-component system OmpR family sensor kinase